MTTLKASKRLANTAAGKSGGHWTTLKYGKRRSCSKYGKHFHKGSKVSWDALKGCLLNAFLMCLSLACGWSGLNIVTSGSMNH